MAPQDDLDARLHHDNTNRSHIWHRKPRAAVHRHQKIIRKPRRFVPDGRTIRHSPKDHNGDSGTDILIPVTIFLDTNLTSLLSDPPKNVPWYVNSSAGAVQASNSASVWLSPLRLSWNVETRSGQRSPNVKPSSILRAPSSTNVKNPAGSFTPSISATTSPNTSSTLLSSLGADAGIASVVKKPTPVISRSWTRHTASCSRSVPKVGSSPSRISSKTSSSNLVRLSWFIENSYGMGLNAVPCPSSDDLRQIAGRTNGGSGSPGW